jgi:hypothetical protein
MRARAVIAIQGKGRAMQSVNCFGNTNRTDLTDEKTDRIAVGRGDSVHGERYFFCWQLKHGK